MSDALFGQIAQAQLATQQMAEKSAMSEEPGFYIPFNLFEIGSTVNINTSPHYLYLCAVPSKATVLEWRQPFIGLGTQNTFNHWAIRLRHGLGPTLLAEFTTNGATGGWELIRTTSFADNTLATADIWVGVHIEKVGAPGMLYMASPLVYCV